MILKLFTSLSRVADVALHDLGGHRAARKALGAVAGHLLGSALLGVKVVLAGLARDNLPRAGNFKPLGK